MKLRHISLGFFSLLLLSTVAGPAWAYHHGGHSHVRFGFYVGVPLWDPWYYPYYYQPYPYYPRVVMTSPPPPPPPSDVEPEPGPRGPTRQPYYRNYCPDAGAYYPQIRECPSGWQLR